MVSRKERFWITFMLRMSFGFLFLIVSLGQFDAGTDVFADKVSSPYSGTWLAGALENLFGFDDGTAPLRFFLHCIPFIFAALTVPILTGLFLRPALRLGAILLIMLGLGKYITSGNDVAPTAMNFFLAFLICCGLYFLGQEDEAKTE